MCQNSGIVGSFCLILLARDALLNPGPIQHPCTVCCRSVRSNQRTLQCDKCQLWSHTKCVGIVDSVYRELQVKDTFLGSVQHVCLLSFLPLR